MLFRAPGMGNVKGIATPVNLREQLRADSETSFIMATREMIGNLDLQLTAFKDKVKEPPHEFKVVPTPEFNTRTGGGSTDMFWIMLVSVLVIAAIIFRRRTLQP